MAGQRGGQGSKGGAALSPRRWHLAAALTGVWWENKNKRSMQIKVFTIPVLGGERANEELNTFLRSKRVLQEEFTKPSRILKKGQIVICAARCRLVPNRAVGTLLAVFAKWESRRELGCQAAAPRSPPALSHVVPATSVAASPPTADWAVLPISRPAHK